MDPDQVYWIQVYFKIEGVEQLVQKESRSASFGTKVATFLQRADPSFMNSVTGFVCRAKCSNILQDIFKIVIDSEGVYNCHFRPSLVTNTLAYYDT